MSWPGTCPGICWCAWVWALHLPAPQLWEPQQNYTSNIFFFYRFIDMGTFRNAQTGFQRWLRYICLFYIHRLNIHLCSWASQTDFYLIKSQALRPSQTKRFKMWHTYSSITNWTQLAQQSYLSTHIKTGISTCLSE